MRTLTLTLLTLTLTLTPTLINHSNRTDNFANTNRTNLLTQPSRDEFYACPSHVLDLAWQGFTPVGQAGF